VFADEKGVEARGAKLLQIGVSAQTRFGNGEAVVGNVIDQLEGGFPPHGESFQVAIVDAEDASFRGQSAVEFGASVYFNERLHGKFAAEGEEVAQERIFEHGDDQKEAVGIIGARFPDLPGIEDKILAQGGQSNLFACIAEVLERAAEEFAFGQNRKRGGAGSFEGFRESRRIERVANDTNRRRSGLEFGDYV